MYKVEIVFKNGDKRYHNVIGIAGYLKELYTYGWFNEAAGLAYPPHMIELVNFRKEDGIQSAIAEQDELIRAARIDWDKLPHYLRDSNKNPYYTPLSREKQVSNPAGYHEIKR